MSAHEDISALKNLGQQPAAGMGFAEDNDRWREVARKK